MLSGPYISRAVYVRPAVTDRSLSAWRCEYTPQGTCLFPQGVTTHTPTHTQYPCCFSHYKAPLTSTLSVTPNLNLTVHLKPDSSTSQPKNSSFPCDAWKYLVNQLHKSLLFWALSNFARTPQGRENRRHTGLMEGCHLYHRVVFLQSSKFYGDAWPTALSAQRHLITGLCCAAPPPK